MSLRVGLQRLLAHLAKPSMLRRIEPEFGGARVRMDEPNGIPDRARAFRSALSMLLPFILAACVAPMSMDVENEAEIERAVGRSLMTAAAGAERQTDYQSAATYYGKLYERRRCPYLC